MKRSITAILAGGAVFGATVAFAATLTVDGNNLGAGTSTVGVCDTVGVDTDYTVAWSSTTNQFEVTKVTVYNLDETNCSGEKVLASIKHGTTWVTSTTAAQSVGANPLTFDIPAGVPAKDANEVAVAMYDGDAQD